MADLLTASGMLVVSLGFVVVVLFAGFWPLMAWSAMRSLKGIRHELERMNEYNERRAFLEAPPKQYTKMGTLIDR